MALTKGKQTCLEKKGIEERKEQVSRNEWIKGSIEYTKALISSEYTIQNEFGYIHPVASSEILFLLERDNCEIENEIIKIIKNNGGLK